MVLRPSGGWNAGKRRFYPGAKNPVEEALAIQRQVEVNQIMETIIERTLTFCEGDLQARLQLRGRPADLPGEREDG